MKTAVHFGAGKIGRGFIADLLHASGYRIVFADVVEPLVDLVNEKHEYSLFLIDNNYEERVIDNVIAYSSVKNPAKVIEAIGEAEVITTSVMATNLSKIAPLLAKGLKARLGKNKSKVTVMACENAIMGTDILKKAMMDCGEITEAELDAVGVYPNTAVDRMVFDGEHHGKKGIEIGAAFELAIERGKLVDPQVEPIKGGEYVDDLGMYLQRKIYIVNCGHAVTSYLGYVKGYATIQEALGDKEILKEVRAAMLESASALEKKYGFTHESLVEYMENMVIKRYTTPGISDPIERVAREPIRKISPNDRIMGPANQCEEYGLANRHLLKGVACALRFVNPEDKQAAELQEFIKEKGVGEAIKKYTGLKEHNPMYKAILEEYNELA